MSVHIGDSTMDALSGFGSDIAKQSKGKGKQGKGKGKGFSQAEAIDDSAATLGGVAVT